MVEILNVFGIDVKMMLIQAVNFAIVLGVLWYFLYTPLIKTIEKRREDTIKAVADAERAANDLAEADSKKKEIVSKATMQAEEIVSNARSTAKEKESEILSDAAHKSERIIGDAHKAGEEAKKQYIAESKEEIAKMVVLGVEKTLRQN